MVAPEGAQIKIDMIQGLIDAASERPHEAPARLLLLRDADRMNANAANALLKTLEEPAPGVHLVLATSAPDRLLDTIRSRCQRVRFGPVSASTIKTILSDRGIPPEQAEAAAALSAGSVGRALASIEDAEGSEGVWELVDHLRKAAGAQKLEPTFEAAATFADKNSRVALLAGLRLLGQIYRDAAITLVGAGDLLVLRERRADIEALAAGARQSGEHTTGLQRAVAAVTEAEQALAANANGALVLEQLLMRLRATERGVERAST